MRRRPAVAACALMVVVLCGVSEEDIHTNNTLPTVLYCTVLYCAYCRSPCIYFSALLLEEEVVTTTVRGTANSQQPTARRAPAVSVQQYNNSPTYCAYSS